MDGVQYRKLAHSYTRVKLTKLTDLPAPNVTVKTKEGGETLIPSGNTYTMTENIVTVTLGSNGNWPLNATIAYDTNGNASPTFSTSYTKPFDVRGAGTIAVFTLVPKAGGGYEYKRAAYTFKLAENLQTVPVSTYGGNCTAYYMKEDGSWAGIFSFSEKLKVGTRVKVVPNTSSGQVLKKWEIVNYDAYNIWGDYLTDEVYKPVLFFNVPKPQYSSPTQTKTLGIKATFADAAEANISEVTKVGLDMSKTVGESISLWDTSKEMRTISCQWWVGDSAGAADNVLPGAVSFDPDKTYTVKVTIKANPGASFTGTAGVEFGNLNRHFTVPNDKITRIGNDTLTFTATPIRQINLTMPAPLTIGDPLPTTADVHGLPAGVTVQAIDWANAPDGTVPDAETVHPTLTLKTDGTRPILVNEYWNPTVNGEEYVYANNTVYDGSMVKVSGIALPVKPKGVEVGGTITSYGSDSESITVQLIEAGHTEPAYEAIVTGNSTTYSFETVPAGTYTLKVEKKGHAPWTEEITVDGSAVTKDVTIYLIGDVNKDGVVTPLDMQRLYNHLNGTAILTETTTADVNQDGSVTPLDMQRLYNHLNGTGPLF